MRSLLLTFFVSSFPLMSVAQQLAPASTQSAAISVDANSEALFAKASEASAVVLTGEGGGRLSGIATAVIVRPNGVLLTAYHVLKNAQEVQVRLHDGDVYDRVEMIGFDERRDIAAIRVTATSLKTLPLGNSETLKQGDALYTVSSSGGLRWSANQGLYSSTRPADEIPAAGSGFRLLQTTIPVIPGASGGPVVDAGGNLVGIFVRSYAGATFAVPIESVAGLADGDAHFKLGGGAALHLPSVADSQTPASAAVTSTTSGDILLHAKTVVILSDTMFLPPETLERALVRNPDFAKLGLALVKDQRVADLMIKIDRVPFTHVHTYTVYDRKTTIVLGSGKVTSFDGITASGPIADQIIKLLTKKTDTPKAKVEVSPSK